MLLSRTVRLVGLAEARRAIELSKTHASQAMELERRDFLLSTSDASDADSLKEKPGPAVCHDAAARLDSDVVFVQTAAPHTRNFATSRKRQRNDENRAGLWNGSFLSSCVLFTLFLKPRLGMESI